MSDPTPPNKAADDGGDEEDSSPTSSPGDEDLGKNLLKRKAKTYQQKKIRFFWNERKLAELQREQEEKKAIAIPVHYT